MKKVCFCLVIAFLLVGVCGYSQRVSISGKGMSLEKVFELIKAQTGFDFVYNQNDIDKAARVDLDVKDVPVTAVLDKCLKPQGFTYEIRNKIIGVRRPVNRKKGIVVEPGRGSIDVSGIVVDTADGNTPLSGASVWVKGTNVGVMTGSSGRFFIKDVAEGSVLQVSYAGYLTKEVEVHDLILNILLERGSGTLDEIQTIAYGKVSNRLNTGNVTTIKGSDIAKQPVSDPLSAMQGLVPGLLIKQVTGAQGGAYSVALRGYGSIASRTMPVYVVDGIPYMAGLQFKLLFSESNQNLAGGSVTDLFNPADIESIDVLKDADATAIYGSQGGNGVILITTKKGRKGPVRVSADVYSGVGEATRVPKYLGLSDFLAMRHEAQRNDGISVGPKDYDINGVWDSTRYTNWPKLLMGKATRVDDAQLQLSGGGSRIQYFAGGGYHRESSIFPDGGENRKASAHASFVSESPDRRLSARLTGTYVAGVNTIQSEQITEVINSAPDAPPIYNPDGSYNFANNTFFNPLAYLSSRYRNDLRNLLMSAQLGFHAAKGLDLRVNVGYHDLAYKEFTGSPASMYNPAIYTDPSLLRQSTYLNDNYRCWTVDPQISYSGHVAKGVVTAVAGGSWQRDQENYHGVTESGFQSDDDLSDPDKAGKVVVSPEEQIEYKYQALFGRMNYNWDNKYLASVSGRYDGTSRFGPEKRYHLFGSVAGAWIFTAESWVKKKFSWLSFGKLRTSYGVIGNDGILNYLYRANYDSAMYTYQGIRGITATRVANPDISWESDRKWEVGLDLGFLKDRILVNMTYYRSKSYNLIQPYNVSVVTGFSEVDKNTSAEIGNNGFELSVQGNNIRTRRFSWSSYGTLTSPRNRVIRLPGNVTASSALVVGQPVNIKMTIPWGGINPQTGLMQFVDSSGKLISYPSLPMLGRDQTRVISLDPVLFGAIGNRFTYKNWTLEALFVYSKQVDYNPEFMGLPAGGLPLLNIPASLAARRWREPGQVTDVQRFGTDLRTVLPYLYAQYSDKAYVNTYYIRLKNLYLAYSFPKQTINKFHMDNLTCYVKGENLFVVTPYRDLDPETSYYIAPTRLLVAGIKAVF